MKNTEEQRYKYLYLLFILKERERTYIQFVLEVLKAQCIKEDNSMSCGDKFISGLLENNNSSNYEVQFMTVSRRNNGKLKGPC